MQHVLTGDLRDSAEFSSVSAAGVTHQAHTDWAGSGRAICTGQAAADADAVMATPAFASGTWRGLFKLGQVRDGHKFFRLRAADQVANDDYAVKRATTTRLELVIEAAGGDVLLGSVTVDDTFGTGNTLGPIVWVEVSIDDVNDTWRLRAACVTSDAALASQGKIFSASGSSASIAGNRDAMVLTGRQGAGGGANSIVKGWQFIAANDVDLDLGPHIYLQTARPNGDDAPLEWATGGSGATHAARVAEAFPHDVDTTYLSATGNSATVLLTLRDRLAMGDVSAPISGGVASQVLGVFAGCVVRNAGAVPTGDCLIRIINAAGGTVTEGVLLTPGVSYEVPPRTWVTAALTKATVDAYRVEIEASVLSTETIRCTAVWMVFVVDSTSSAIDTAAGAELDLPLREEADAGVGVEAVPAVDRGGDVDPATGVERDLQVDRADDRDAGAGAERDELERASDFDLSVGVERDDLEHAEADTGSGVEPAEALGRDAAVDVGTGAERDERTAEADRDISVGVEGDALDRVGDVEPATGAERDDVARDLEFDPALGVERDEVDRDTERDVASGTEPALTLDRELEPDMGSGVEESPGLEREAHFDVGDGAESTDALDRGPHGDEALGVDVGNTERDGIETGQGFEDQAVLLQQLPMGVVVSPDNGGAVEAEHGSSSAESEHGSGTASFEAGSASAEFESGGSPGGGGEA